MLPRFLGALILSGFALSCAGPEPEGAMPANEDWHLLPADFAKDFFFLPIQLDGEESRTLWFLFDTGANVNLVDADSLAAVSSWEPGMSNRVNVAEATCGPMTLRKLSMRVQSLDHLQAAVQHPLDGILGYGALEDVLVQLDYPGEQMKIVQGILPKPDGHRVFPLKRADRPFLTMDFGGARRNLLLDSGSSSGFEIREGRGLDWEYEAAIVGTGMAIGGLEWNYAGRMKGTHPFLSQSFISPVAFLTQDEQLVGTQILRHFTLIFDQRTDRLFAKPAQESPVEPEALMGYAIFLEPTTHGRRVIGVKAGSQAEADGWLVGDYFAVPEKSREEAEPETMFDVERGEERLRLPLLKEALIPISG